jgi:hypothetical protein
MTNLVRLNLISLSVRIMLFIVFLFICIFYDLCIFIRLVFIFLLSLTSIFAILLFGLCFTTFSLLLIFTGSVNHYYLIITGFFTLTFFDFFLFLCTFLQRLSSFLLRLFTSWLFLSFLDFFFQLEMLLHIIE